MGELYVEKPGENIWVLFKRQRKRERERERHCKSE